MTEIDEITLKLFRGTDLNNIMDIIETMEKHEDITEWNDNFISESGSDYHVEITKLKD